MTLKRVRPNGGVGYGRPPAEHQYKPGQSGNPKGRPKGAKNESTILHQLLHRKVELRIGGRLKKVTLLEAILLRIAEDSLKGNTKSASFLLNRYGAIVSGEAPSSVLSEDDQDILEAFARRLDEQRHTKAKSKSHATPR